MFKKMVVGTLVVLSLTLGFAGAVFAQGPQPPIDGVCPYGGACDGYGYGMGGYGYHGSLPAILADALGLSVDELFAALSNGQSIADLAAAQGLELGDLVQVLVAPRVERIQQAVEAGSLTQEQADELIAEMTEHMLWRLENLGLGYGYGYGHGYGHGCGMMNGGFYYGPSGTYGGMRGGRWGGGFSAPNWSAPAPTS